MNDETTFLVLRQTDYKENDLILGGLSPEGQVSFVGKALKKTTSKNAYACQLFSECVIQYDRKPDKDIYLMKTASLVNGHRPLREDLDLQIVASVIAELSLKVQNGTDLFEMTKKAFQELEKKERPFTVLSLYLSDLLKREGNQPMADACVRCGNTKGIVAFSVEDGGFVCADCAKLKYAKPFETEDLKMIRILVKGSMENLEKIPVEAEKAKFARLLLDHVIYHTGIRLISKNFFDTWYPED